MDNLIILFLVLVVMAILARTSRRESSFQKDDILVYRYSRGVIWITAFVMVFFILFTPWSYFTDRLEGVGDVIGLSAFALFGFILWFFFYLSRIYITEKEIIKDTPFWQTTIPYNEIKKIIIYRSPANPGAAMTRVHGKKKITLEALLVGYEELVDDLRSRCRHAEVIEK